MKVLIWVGCILLNSIIVVGLKESGITLGGIPTALLYIATIGLAPGLCAKWDNNRKAKEKSRVDQIRFCRKCGVKLIEGGRFCGKCGTEIVSEHDDL